MTPSEPGDRFTVSVDYNGVAISAGDFPRDLRGYVAWQIAVTLSTYCADKEAAVELLLAASDDIFRVHLASVRAALKKPLRGEPRRPGKPREPLK